MKRLLFVRMEQDRNSAYPVAFEHKAWAVLNDGPTTVGVYQLVQTIELCKRVEERPKTPRKTPRGRGR